MSPNDSFREFGIQKKTENMAISDVLGMDDDMAISEVIRRVTQRNHSALLSGMADVSQKRVADLIGVSEATLSAMKSENLERFAALAAACGLKLVKTTDRTMDDAHITALETLAARSLRSGTRSRHDELED